MRYKNKKTALKAVFLYLLLSGGSWMFINSYANSYNMLSPKSITPAGIILRDEELSVKLLGHSNNFDISLIAPDSKAYCGIYILAPDEVRTATYIISLCI